jgi:hypothetical protein
MARPSVFVLAASLAAAGCGEMPTQPRERSEPVLLIASCNPAGTAISCSSFILHAPGLPSAADVTGTTVWTAEPADAAAVVGPGQFTPLRSGEVELRARYQNWQSSPPNPRFLIAPDTPPRRLATVFFLVREMEVPPTGNPNAPPIAGAVVTLLEGYRAGISCTTPASGTCSLDPVSADETYTISVTKEGYRPANVEVRGDLGAPRTVPVWLPRR